MTPSVNLKETPAITAFDPTDGVGASKGSGVSRDKIETIREILVGEEIENLDHRFQELEISLDGRQARLRKGLTAKLEALEAQSKSELKDVGDMVVEMVGQLQVEDHAQAGEIEKMGTRLGDLEQRVDDMNDALSGQLRSFREEFSKQMEEFSQIIKTQQEDVARQAITRSDFAELLNGLAGSLTQEESPEE